MLLHNDVFDNGLNALTDNGNALHICNSEPATYAEATSTNSLGSKTGLNVGSPEDGSSGRKVVVPQITDGSVSGDGTATHWAVVDTNNSKLLAAGSLSSSQSVTNGNTFTLAAFDIQINDPS